MSIDSGTPSADKKPKDGGRFLEPLEEALKIPYAIKEHNGGNPREPEKIRKAIGAGRDGNAFFYLTARHYEGRDKREKNTTSRRLNVASNIIAETNGVAFRQVMLPPQAGHAAERERLYGAGDRRISVLWPSVEMKSP